MASAIVIILVALIAGILLLRSLRQRNQAPSNQYKRQPRKLKPRNTRRDTDSYVEYELPAEESTQTAIKKKPIAPKLTRSKKDPFDDMDEALGLKQDSLLQEKEPEPEANSPKTATTSANKPRDYVIVFCQAENGRDYTGYELLQALLSSGLRYGSDSMFHRYSQQNGQGDVIFSLSAATSKGVFDLPRMGGFSCKGLTLFFSLSTVKNPLESYQSMLNTAGQLIEDLGGSVLDEAHRPLTQETAVDTQRAIRDYLKQQPTADMFVE